MIGLLPGRKNYLVLAVDIQALKASRQLMDLTLRSQKHPSNPIEDFYKVFSSFWNTQSLLFIWCAERLNPQFRIQLKHQNFADMEKKNR